MFNLIRDKQLGEAEIIDLNAYNFPLFNERLKYQESPSEKVKEFAEKVRNADGIIIITPEYNGGYPASLKNSIDLLTDEWRKKPVSFITVSDGNFAGTQVITALQFVFWKLGALTVPSSMRLPNIDQMFDENGIPSDRTSTDKRATDFLKELLWMVEAKRRMSD